MSAFRRIACVVALVLAGLLGVTSAASAEIYWANSGNGTGTTIGSASNDGSGANQAFITTAIGDDYKYPRGVAANSRHIFWSAGGQGGVGPTGIGRAAVDGSGADPDFISDPAINYPSGLALDSTYVYWIDSWADTIGRARLDGTEVDPDFITLGSPGYVAHNGIGVDSQYIYWAFTGVNDGDGKIGRVAKDGSSPDPDFITGLWAPRSPSAQGEHLFWCDYQTGRLGRSSIDGTDSNRTFGTESPSYGCFEMTTDDRYLYYSSWGSGGTNIVRMNIDGTDPDTDFITGANYPFGVSVTNPAGSLSPTSHDFGETEAGAGPTGTQTFTLASTGDAPLTIPEEGILMTGTDPSEFTLVDGVSLGSCQPGTTSLANGESCTVEVAFEPGSTGALAATLEVVTNAGLFTASLTGEGIAPAGSLSPTSHDFGEAEAGAEPTGTRIFTLASSGGIALTIVSGGIALTGPDTGDFRLTGGTCQAGTTSLANGESCTVEVAFEPGSTGAKAATLEVATNAEPFAASLTGTGVPPPGPSFSAVRLSSKAKRVKAPRKGKKKVSVTVRVTNSGEVAGTASVRLRSSSRKVRVPRRLTVQVGAGSARSRSFKATVLPRAPRKATVTATLPDGRKARLVLKIRR